MKQKKPTTKTPKAVTGGPMDLVMLEQLVKLMSANDLSTIALREGDKRVVLRRGAQVVHSQAYAPTHMAPPAAAPAATPAPAAASADPDAGLVAIKSPMVGTYYAASSPEAKPFVSVGSTVDEDTDVCIIEAMKVFNNIKAETRGTIAKVLITNGQSVEFGQALFMVRP